MKISVIILTFDSEQNIERCISSIVNSKTMNEYEIIVIDNASNDNTINLIKKAFPQVHLIQNTSNKGVAPARNQGLDNSTGDYILFLDDDAYLLPETLELLASYLNNNSKCGIVGPQMLNPDQTLQFNALPIPSVSIKLKRIVQRIFHIKAKPYYIEKILNTQNFEPGYLIGACQLIRKKVIEITGKLDEHIFYGPEDADLCLRVKKCGFQVVCVPQAKAIHAYRRSSYNFKRINLLLAHVKGLFYFWFKHL